jgi:putative SOS response-associated peptidase YedK
MCGRFPRNYTWAQIYAMYHLTSPSANIQPNFNVCPTDTVDVVVRGGDERILHPMRWGLIPGWWKKPLNRFGFHPECVRAFLAESPDPAAMPSPNELRNHSRLIVLVPAWMLRNQNRRSSCPRSV